MIHFEIEADGLARIGSELGATEKQVKLAFSRALGRTASTLRRMSERGLKDELQLRVLKFLRLRLKTLKMRKGKGEDIMLWYGLNDMPVGELKGRPTKTAAGASFRGKEFAGGFKGKNKRKQPTIFKRVGGKSHPIAEQEMPVKDKMETFVEDRIFDKADEIFWRHFEKDLAARVKYKLGAA